MSDMTNLTEPTAAIVGEQVAGESAKVRKSLEKLIQSVNKSTFDIGELLHKIKKNGFYNSWGFNTFQEYVDTLDIKPRKAQYLVRIVDTMEAVGVQRETYEPLGVAKLREISSLDPTATYTNPQTNEETPMKDFIVGFVEKGNDMPLEDLKQHVRTLKGFVGENDIVWLNLCLKRSALDETVRPALELAKNNIGSVGKDSEGMSIDASDGRALEAIAVEYLNDPANNVLPEGATVMDVTKITPAIIRTAFQVAAGRGLKFPSPEFEEFVSRFLNGLRDVKKVQS